jgi:hypothetical protein
MVGVGHRRVVAAMVGSAPRYEQFASSDGAHPGLHVGFASAALVVATAVAATWPASAGMWRLILVAAVVLLTGVFGAAAGTVAVVAVGAWLMAVGFLVGQYGVLAWSGTSDIYRLVVIAAAGAAGLAIGALRRWARRTRPVVVPPEWSLEWSAAALATPPDPTAPPNKRQTSTKEENGHDGRPGVRGADARVVRGARPSGVGGETAVTSTVDGPTETPGSST